MIVYGSGNYLRDFIHIKDVVDLLFIAKLKQANNKIYNLSYGKSYSLLYLLKFIKKLVNLKKNINIKILTQKWPKNTMLIEKRNFKTSINKIKEDYGVIYGLVNNAGITNDNLLMRMSDEQWNSVIETNLTSLYRVTKSVVKDMMKARTGRIVNIGSIVGMMGNAGQSNYSATKSGLLGFTKSLAREVSSRNINVNAISPGFIDTDMTRALSEEQIEALTKNIPLGRIASPDEVSSVVAFLLSDDSSYITGENINVNGGLYM